MPKWHPILVRVARIELALSRWQRDSLPLTYTRFTFFQKTEEVMLVL